MWGIEEKEKLNEFEVWGDIDPHNISSFCQRMIQLPVQSRLDMWDLCVEDGPTLAQLISALRLIAPCTIVGAPQMLAHTLYKINALQSIRLEEPRSF